MSRIPWLSLIGAAALAGCASPPDPRRPAAPIAPAAATPRGDGAVAELGFPSGAWWLVYGDPQLNALIAEALAGAPTLEQAIARLRTADLSDGRVAVGGRQRATDFDLGLWAGDRIVLTATLPDAGVTRLELEQANILVATGVVAAYGDLWRRMTDLSTFDNAAHHTRSAGVTPSASSAGPGRRRVKSARVDPAQVRAPLEAEFDVARRRLAALLGRRPEQPQTLGRPVAVTGEIRLAAGQVEQLLARRPDLVAARWRAAAGEPAPGPAPSAKFASAAAPTGVRAFGFNGLVRSGSDLGQASLVLPLWTPETRDASGEDYERAAAGALRDVGEAITTERLLEAKLLQARRDLFAAEADLHGDPRRQAGGAVAPRPPRAANDTVFALRDRVAGLQARRLIADACLVRALRGAVRPTAAPWNGR